MSTARSAQATAWGAALVGGLLLLAGPALPLSHGFVPALLVWLAAAMWARRSARLGSIAAPEADHDHASGASLTRLESLLRLLALAVLAGSVTGSLGRMLLATDGAWAGLLGAVVWGAALWLRPRATAVAGALAVVCVVGAGIGLAAEAGDERAGAALSGPVFGVHPFQMISVRIDGYGPHDIALPDYVQHPEGKGYTMQGVAAALQRALHQIAELHYAQGPSRSARAYEAYADARVTAVARVPAVREHLDEPARDEVLDRLLIRAGSHGARSEVELVCPGVLADPIGDVTSPACPDAYAAEGNAGLGMTGRWAGFQQWLGAGPWTRLAAVPAGWEPGGVISSPAAADRAHGRAAAGVMAAVVTLALGVGGLWWRTRRARGGAASAALAAQPALTLLLFALAPLAVFAPAARPAALWAPDAELSPAGALAVLALLAAPAVVRVARTGRAASDAGMPSSRWPGLWLSLFATVFALKAPASPEALARGLQQRWGEGAVPVWGFEASAHTLAESVAQSTGWSFDAVFAAVGGLAFLTGVACVAWLLMGTWRLAARVTGASGHASAADADSRTVGDAGASATPAHGEARARRAAKGIVALALAVACAVPFSRAAASGQVIVPWALALLWISAARGVVVRARPTVAVRAVQLRPAAAVIELVAVAGVAITLAGVASALAPAQGWARAYVAVLALGAGLELARGVWAARRA